MNFHTRKWVKPEDLNPNGTLFGGSLLRWIDEEAAIYAIVQLGNQRVVTKYISEINFVSASRQGDIIELGITATEFGRTARVNGTQGTDHGTAGPMFIAGKPVRGGQYGAPVDLAKRGADDNLQHTTDFRRVYATLVEGWLGVQPERQVLRGRFEPFPVFG